ncbi:MAG: hypothetical protein DLM53_04040 [Candidatus Eremiobacter antarcticus]|nr:response regulator [Candidatus Eremiobacteraeota bacterium]MBC5807446.1 response regulator [Candidatus Eremiobacteraeota bacterium]PZR63184.1 MAG: hypothetical protein DLM53_04040 [Candidatus Eremiobacter sp. RRmetagenome_bin22]
MDVSAAELLELNSIFRAECDEHVAALNPLLLKLEATPLDQAALYETFRRVHSIKGAARMVGYSGLEAVAHAMETMLAQAREGRQHLSAVYIAKLFAGRDAIESLLAADAGRSSDEPDVLSAVRRLTSADVPGAREAAVEHANVRVKISDASPALPQLRASDSGGPADRRRSGDMLRVSEAKISALLNTPNELMRWHVLEEHDLKDLRERVEALFDRIDAANRIDDRDLRHAALEQALMGISKQRDPTQALVKAITERNARRPRSLEDLRQGLASLRMLPVNTILAGMPRLARDTALALGKKVELKIYGAEVEIGKSVLDRLMEPLIQMVKNAIAHGIETPEQRVEAGKPPAGLIKISVSTGTASATIAVEDDGRGLDSERIRAAAVAQGLAAPEEAQALPEGKLIPYLFKPGFSTTEETDSISGRGVGLDIVAECVRQLRGTYQVENAPGKGLRLLLTVPVTLLWSPVLQLRSGGFDVCVRLADIREANVLRSSDALEIDGRLSATVRGEVIPLLPLTALSGGDNSVDFGADDKVVAVTLQQGERRAAFVVDNLTDVSDVIIKALPWPLAQLPGMAGYCVLASGSAMCVLDGEYLVNAAHDRQSGGTMRTAPAAAKPNLLIVDDSLTTRTLLRSIMMSAGYDASTAVDGVDAWAKIQSGHYDCIVSDIEMPNMNGWDLCARVKGEQRWANTPFVLITSLSKDDERRRGFEAGADAYIVKSLFNEKELLETVQRLTV